MFRFLSGQEIDDQKEAAQIVSRWISQVPGMVQHSPEALAEQMQAGLTALMYFENSAAEKPWLAGHVTVWPYAREENRNFGELGSTIIHPGFRSKLLCNDLYAHLLSKLPAVHKLTAVMAISRETKAIRASLKNGFRAISFITLFEEYPRLAAEICSYGEFCQDAYKQNGRICCPHQDENDEAFCNPRIWFPQ